MRVGVLGTGIVGRAIAAKLRELGHDVVVGTRDPDERLAVMQQRGPLCNVAVVG